MPNQPQLKISSLLSGEHSRLGALLDNLSKNSLSQNQRITNQSFVDLKNELAKHFNIEEEVIFKFIQPIDNEIYSFIPLLVKEHDLINKELNVIKKSLVLNNRIDVHKIRIQLTKHKEFEDSTFYPKLDTQLSQDQKNIIIKKLKNKFKKEYKYE